MSTHALSVGDLLPQGRVVAVANHPGTKPWAWLERRRPDGTVEREMFFLDELAPALPIGTANKEGE